MRCRGQMTLVFCAYCSVGVLCCPVPPCRPSVRRDPNGLWYVWVLEPVESKTRTYHGQPGRGARRNGGAGSGRTGCQQNCSPRGHASLAPSKESKTSRLNVFPEARTSEILCKPMQEQSPRLNRGLTAGREALFVPGC